MLVKMLADGETYNGHYKEGDVKDLNMSVAQALIKQGKAEEYTPTQEGAEEESTRDLNEEAKDAAAKDAEAARDETKNRTAETKSDTKPTSGTRTSRP
jgi:peptidoglycan hydrolase CwlO-like protein